MQIEKHIIRYQMLPENFFDMVKRRKVKPAECFLAIYLRGKCGSFGNPFYLSDKVILSETCFSVNALSRTRRKLQEKGLIKFDTFNGRGKLPIYTMLDSFMLTKTPQNGKQTHQNRGFNSECLSIKTPQNGGLRIIKNKDKKQTKDSSLPKDPLKTKTYNELLGDRMKELNIT